LGSSHWAIYFLNKSFCSPFKMNLSSRNCFSWAKGFISMSGCIIPNFFLENLKSILKLKLVLFEVVFVFFGTLCTIWTVCLFMRVLTTKVATSSFVEYSIFVFSAVFWQVTLFQTYETFCKRKIVCFEIALIKSMFLWTTFVTNISLNLSFIFRLTSFKIMAVLLTNIFCTWDSVVSLIYYFRLIFNEPDLTSFVSF